MLRFLTIMAFLLGGLTSSAAQAGVRCFAYSIYSDNDKVYSSDWYSGWFPCTRASSEAVSNCEYYEGTKQCRVIDCEDELGVRGACR